jgi:CheY-like chemotaxis protein
MLAFSRARPGREARPLAPQPLVSEALKMLGATIPAGIGIETRYAADAPDVAIDPVDLHQILVNLVINARDALDGRGKISISLARATVDQQVCSTCKEKFSGDFLQLTVADDGQGIAAETLPHIFEPFFTTKPVGQGSGMGLSMVHGLVRRAGGHCQVESTLGAGSAFHIYLPAAKLPAAAAQAVAPPTPAASSEPRGHLLLVDDETPLLRLLHTNLQAAGWRVSCFANPRQALAVFRDAPTEFDAVVSDQSMPDMTGVELISALHALRPALPAILCTGYNEALDAATLQRQGIHSLLLKPMENDELLAALEAAMLEHHHIQ